MTPWPKQTRLLTGGMSAVRESPPDSEQGGAVLGAAHSRRAPGSHHSRLCTTVSPSISHEVMGLDAMIFVFCRKAVRDRLALQGGTGDFP